MSKPQAAAIALLPPPPHRQKSVAAMPPRAGHINAVQQFYLTFEISQQEEVERAAVQHRQDVLHGTLTIRLRSPIPCRLQRSPCPQGATAYRSCALPRCVQWLRNQPAADAVAGPHPLEAHSGAKVVTCAFLSSRFSAAARTKAVEAKSHSGRCLHAVSRKQPGKW